MGNYIDTQKVPIYIADWTFAMSDGDKPVKLTVMNQSTPLLPAGILNLSVMRLVRMARESKLSLDEKRRLIFVPEMRYPLITDIKFKRQIGISNLTYSELFAEISNEFSKGRIFVKRKSRKKREKLMLTQTIENGFPDFFISTDHDEQRNAD